MPFLYLFSFIWFSPSLCIYNIQNEKHTGYTVCVRVMLEQFPVGTLEAYRQCILCHVLLFTFCLHVCPALNPFSLVWLTSRPQRMESGFCFVCALWPRFAPVPVGDAVPIPVFPVRDATLLLVTDLFFFFSFPFSVFQNLVFFLLLCGHGLVPALCRLPVDFYRDKKSSFLSCS